MGGVVIAERDALERSALQRLFRHYLPSWSVQAFATGAEAERSLLPRTKTFLIGRQLADGCGLKTARVVRSRHPSLRIVVMSPAITPTMIGEAFTLRLGLLRRPYSAQGLTSYLTQSPRRGPLRPDDVVIGAASVPPADRDRAITELAGARGLEANELAVLLRTSHGQQPNQICEALNISERRLDEYAQSIAAKTGATDMVQVVARALACLGEY